MKFRKLIILISIILPVFTYAQESNKVGITVNYDKPQKYVIGGVKVTGVKYLNEKQIIMLSGLNKGEEIVLPSDESSSIIKKIWGQKLFSNVSLYIDSLSQNKDTVYLCLNLQERPRVSKWVFEGIKSSQEKELKEKLHLRRASEYSEYKKRQWTKLIKDYYNEKGFIRAKIEIIIKTDKRIKNAIQIVFKIDKGKKVKVKRINFYGNHNVKDGKILSKMENTKDQRIRNFLKSKKFKEKEYKEDLNTLLLAFNEQGYRDAKVIRDSIYEIKEARLGIDIYINEGKQYFFRNITWTGNSLYTSQQLSNILKISKGDIYDVILLQKRLFGDPKKQEMDVGSLYKNKGYLFFNIVPVEINIDKDSIDVEMRIVEGKPALFNNIVISGNNITNERVVRRQIFTRPGYLYSQQDFERSIREISSMGHFDPEYAVDPAKGYSIIPNQMNNTVDLTYNVAEKPDSKLNLSGGWGGYSFVGTIGVSFNNFSVRRMFKKGAWRPVPYGDAQSFALNFQTNGTYYTALQASFSEPWLFGKKPTSLSISTYYTKQTNSYYWYANSSEQSMKVYGATVSLGNRLKWPDNYFQLYHALSLQTYELNDWNYYFIFSDGYSNNLSYKITLARNSTDQMIYPRSGSDFVLGLQLTPPYSLFRSDDTDYSSMEDSKRYRWIEYHKWTAKGTLYTKLIGDLVLMTRAQFGYLGYYNKDLGYSPFEGFQVGGDGMSGYNTYGAEVVALRGYANYSLTPLIDGAYAGHVYDKFTMELRYPVVLQPSSTIYVLGFLEGGNCWYDMKQFQPFSIKRSAGIGLRIFLPAIGLLGIDWGYGFDPINGETSGSNFHFVIGQQF
ncbi:MAG: outer membrane protein assembly factor BamA [Bacteroidales bacterium]